MRLLLWLVLALLVVLAIQKKFRAAVQPTGRVRSDEPSAVTPAASAEDMVCCTRCQVYFPVSEAVYRDQQVYCCAAHADAH